VVAAELGHTEVAEVLINYGADLQMQEKVCIKLTFVRL
jgi:leucyl aminopeptidase (aminopeptidase T)